MDRKGIEKAILDKKRLKDLNEILAPFSRSFLIKQIWDEEPTPCKRSTIFYRFKKGNWTKLELMRIDLMLSDIILNSLKFADASS